MKFAVIADDLTGSSDSGVQFARKGLESSVLFNIEEADIAKVTSDVIVVDTDSRALNKEKAYQSVKNAARKLGDFPFNYLYKKLDSTLRGNIGAEIDAVLTVFPKDFAIIAPAFPSIGRTTKKGEHYLEGQLIHHTEIANDPKTPVLESNIERLLKFQTPRPSATITLAELNKGKDFIHSKLKEFKDKGIELIVFDAEEDNDLTKIVQSVMTTTYDVLWVGSAGLADHLVSVLEIKNKKPTHFKPLQHHPVLVVAGSLSEVTNRQINFMRDKKAIFHVELDPIVLFDSTTKELEIERCRLIAQNKFELGLDVVLHAGTSKEQLQQSMEKGLKANLTKTEISNLIANSLGEIAARLLDNNQVAGIVLTGGDTAKAVSRYLGVTGMNLIKEVEKGIPLGRLVGDLELNAVTKAGAFGTEAALYKAVQLLKGDD